MRMVQPSRRRIAVNLKKYSEIIERIEFLRDYLGLNKSRFSAEIGMKPQTYNNFIGSQGSKPNIELISGIINKFNVSPHWLLNGVGSIFDEEKSSAPRDSKTTRPVLVKEGDSIKGRGFTQEEWKSFQSDIKSLEPSLLTLEGHFKSLERKSVPVQEQILNLLRRYYELDPLSAIAEMKETLERIETRLSESAKNNKEKKKGSGLHI